MTFVFRAAAVAALSGLAASPVLAAGLITLDFEANSDDLLRSLAVGSDGRIYAAVVQDTSAGTCGIYGLDVSGTLIPTFGSGGRLLLPHCVTEVQARSDGGLAVMEYPGLPQTRGAHLVFRNATGAVVSELTGNFFIPPTLGGSNVALLFATRPDGRFIIAGSGSNSVLHSNTWAFARLNADGSADTSFSSGTLVLLPNTYVGRVSSVYPLADGKTLASGTVRSPDIVSVSRLNTDGTIDLSFGTAGRRDLLIGPGVSALDSSGRIYVPERIGKVVRLSADGVVDAGYDGGTSNASVRISSIALDSQGRAVVFGSTVGNAGYVARLDTNGDPDATFNGTGSAQVALAGSVVAEDLLAEPCSGKLQTGDLPILACGVRASGDASKTDLSIARFTTTGALDMTFGVNQPDSDPYPDAFSFPPATAPARSVDVTSQSVTLTGFNGRTSAWLSSADPLAGFAVGCTPPYEKTGIINPGDNVCVRQSASLQAGGVTQSELVVGGTIGRFTVTATNDTADVEPDAFSFAAQTDVATSTQIVSNAVTISGIAGLASVSVNNGQYSLGCQPSVFTNAAGTITNGQTICVRHLSAAARSTMTTTTLTIGGVSAPFSTTTLPQDTQPDAFTFTDQTGVQVGSTVTSNTVTIGGIEAAANVSVTGGEYSVGCNGTFTTQAGTIQSAQTVCVRHTASSQPSTTVTTTLTIGGVSDAFASTTAAASGGGGGEGGGGGGGGGALDWRTLASLLLLASATLVRRVRRRTQE